MRKILFLPFILTITSLLLLIGCAKSDEYTVPIEKETTDKVEVKVLSGELITLAVHSISIRTDTGMEYCFAIDENTERDKEKLEVGDKVEVSYATNMTSMAKSIEINES